MEEASFASGAKNWTTLQRVTLPVLRPALLAAVLYEFASSMESFEAPLVLGLPGRIYVYSTMIYISTRDAIPNYGLGAAFAASFFSCPSAWFTCINEPRSGNPSALSQ